MKIKDIFGIKWQSVHPTSKTMLIAKNNKIWNKVPSDFKTPIIQEFVKEILDTDNEGIIKILFDHIIEKDVNLVSLSELIVVLRAFLQIKRHAKKRMKIKENHQVGFAVTALNKTLEFLRLSQDGCQYPLAYTRKSNQTA